ncbi:MAG: phosphoenolpyruvate carboxykinase (ATP), partial [Candidatus Hydrogenedentota bacterium]
IWWNEGNKPISPEKADRLFHKIRSHLSKKDLYVKDAFAGAEKKSRLSLRVITETAWHSAFADNMFIQPTPEELHNFSPEIVIYHAPTFFADPEVDGTRSQTFVILDLVKKRILIGGTGYAGEIKKSIFTTMNYLLPKKGIMSMHCSANVGKAGDTAIFFGLSGTGKTTLSSEKDRALIGDDEHGWSDEGVFNIEGGCYAKMIRLSKEAEPEIYATTQKFGTILENVIYDEATRRIDFDSDAITENTRGSYPLTHLDNIVPENKGPHPKNIIMLTADAFGVLPPISKLTPEQAMYHFISGYTAKVAGTEAGIVEPVATFSACFGAPFMPLHPTVYAKMLGEKIAKHGVHVYLVNTGWTGGPYGVGSRMPIQQTRAMIHGILDGSIREGEWIQDPHFGLTVPKSCPNVDSNLLLPENTWKDKEAYKQTAEKLKAMFRENFKQYEDQVSEEIVKAGF